MKELLSFGKAGIAYGIAAGVSIKFGMWLWDEVLEEKLDELKDRFAKD